MLTGKGTLKYTKFTFSIGPSDYPHSFSCCLRAEWKKKIRQTFHIEMNKIKKKTANAF